MCGGGGGGAAAEVMMVAVVAMVSVMVAVVLTVVVRDDGLGRGLIAMFQTWSEIRQVIPNLDSAILVSLPFPLW